MTEIEIPQENLPLYAQKQAQRMVADTTHLHQKVRFLLITPVFAPADCVWIDPGFGFFAIKGKEDIGFMSVKDLPEGTLIVNQRYDSADGD
jgi:hypothetical protein